MTNKEVVADRAIDTVFLASGATVLLQQVEHLAVIFSVLACGCYYLTNTYWNWRDRGGKFPWQK